MNKAKKSILNAVTALIQMVVTCLMGLIFNKTILEIFGSAYNGVNATVTQIINTIMIIEGGFTLASNVSLFEPWANKDTYGINGILSATRKKFSVIGWISAAIGAVVAFLYPLTVKESMPYFVVVGLMLTVLLPTCFNLGVTTKHRVVLLTEQKEYVISLISTITYVMGTLSAILAMRYLNCSILMARTIIMVSLFANYITIGIYCKKKYPFVSYKEKPLYEKIKGTKSVIALKLTSVIYASAPIIIISMIPEKGFVLASVYSVYNSVMSIVNGGLNAIVNAPRLSFGALFAEKDSVAVKNNYSQYEAITFIGLAVILGATGILVMPFISVYTAGIDDANYYDVLMAVLLIAKNFLEIAHIPSGQMIQMSGSFKVSNKIQIVACSIQIMILLVGLVLGNVYIVVFAILCAAITLAILEICYTEIKLIKRGWGTFLQSSLPALVICVVSTFIGTIRPLKCSNYFEFLIIGIITVVTLTVITLVSYYIVDPKCVKSIIGFLIRNISRKRKEN